jgi:hypothetical protein
LPQWERSSLPTWERSSLPTWERSSLPQWERSSLPTWERSISTPPHPFTGNPNRALSRHSLTPSSPTECTLTPTNGNVKTPHHPPSFTPKHTV